ncbi:MAG: right-handed parallel beta-helix repeat-containing protein [Salinivirgaceae bacterium]|nr:right-handed parallel beta-helix repeat-containing protein [Salinivirgaceae bacterium]
MKKTSVNAVKFKKLVKGTLLLGMLLFGKVNAQNLEVYDYHDPNDTLELPKNVDLLSEYGGVHTPQGALKVLLVFAQFEGDIHDTLNATWPTNALPNYNNVLYTSINSFNPGNTDLSISNYYYQMSQFSGNPFKMYGELFPEVIKIPQPTTDYSFSHFTNQVFDSIEAKYPNYHWDTFDQRTNNPYWRYSNVNSPADDSLDYVIISFRWDGGKDPWGNNQPGDTLLLYHYKQQNVGGVPTGWASITNQTLNTNTGTYKVTSGFTSALGLQGADGFREFFLHEFGHNLYNAPHYNGANSVVGRHLFTNSGWGMMGSGARHKYCTLGWEQWWLGWNNIDFDLNNSTQNNTYALYDFLSTGDMMRLKIPNTNQYLWLEFHSGQSVFEKRGSLTNNAQGVEFPQNANGVLAYIENISDNKTIPGIFDKGANGIKYIHGAGNFEYGHSATVAYDPAWWPAIYDFYPGTSEPFAMQNGVTAIRSDYNSNNKINYNPNTISPNSGGNGNEMGSIVKTNGIMTYDEYGKNMNLVAGKSYSISSNPAIIEHQYFYSPENINPDHSPAPYYYYKDSLSPIRLHGLRITIGNITSTSAQIHVVYDYNQVDEDVRWTGNIELPESQPIDINGATVTLDRTGTASCEFPDQISGFYPYSSFNLREGSSLQIINNGSLILDENTTMHLNEGSDFNVISGLFEIKSGSSLIVNSGNYNITNNGVITINGNITLKENANVTISGSGYIVLNGTISAEPGASLTIGGAGNTTTLLEVQKSISFDTDFSNVTIQNGKVVMNNSTSELLINQGVDNVVIDNVWVTSSTGTNNGHQGIDIRSDYNVNISNSTFEQGYYGLYASRGATSPNLDVSNCTFKYCSYGLRVYNGGLTADGCTVEYNTVRGIYCNSMDLAGSINNSTIRYQNGTGDYGLYYDGASTSTLTLLSNTVSSNYYGAMVNGSFNTLFKCNTLNDNTDFGVYSNNSPVYFADATGISAGNNQLYSNNYGIKIYGTTSMFYLNNGYNELRSDTYCMYGTLEGVAGGSIAANNNYWKTGGGAPVSGTNYVLNGALSPITLTDNSPEGAYYLCEAPGDLIEGTATATTPDEPAAYRTVTTDLGTLPMDETVATTLNTEAENGTVYDDETRYGLMAQLLNNNLSGLNPAEEKQATHTYRMFRSSLGAQIGKNGKADPVQLDNMLQVIRKLQDDDKQNEGRQVGKKHTARYFALSVDEAQTLWLKQDYTGAIALLQSLIAKATADQQCEIRKLICQVEADREFIASNNILEIEELLAQCSECGGSEKSGTVSTGGNEQNAETGANLSVGGVSLSVVPHPVTGTSEIQVAGLQQTATLTVYNSLGAMVLQREVADENSTVKISRGELEPGIYLITLNLNGSPLQTLKMVVQ